MQTGIDKTQNVLSQRRGKIARLPREIREELNVRLDDGLEADQILPWLNDLPDVREVVAEQFNGVPISPQNLSAWRQGGFREWLLLHELLDSTVHVSEHLEEIGEVLECDHSEDVPLAIADQMISQLAIRFNAFLASWGGGPLDAEPAMLLKIGQFILKLQAGAYRAQRQGAQIGEARRQAEQELEREIRAEAYRDHLMDRAKARKAKEMKSEDKEAPVPAGGEKVNGRPAARKAKARAGSATDPVKVDQGAGPETETALSGSLPASGERVGEPAASATGQSSSVKVNQGSGLEAEAPLCGSLPADGEKGQTPAK
jgi:hypothetical protein